MKLRPEAAGCRSPEHDNDLWLRGHIGTRAGRKGSASLGSRYMLFNWETDKNLYRNGILTLKLGPLLDTGKIAGSSVALGANEWLWDTGMQSKISVLGISVTVIYGKDCAPATMHFIRLRDLEPPRPERNSLVELATKPS